MKPVQFSASRMGELLAGGTGKTRWNYIYDLGLKTLGFERDISTPAMKHGLNNEMNALLIAKELLGCEPNLDGNGGQNYYKINDYVGATPDAIGNDFVLDSKCQYHIYTYLEQCDKLAAKYYTQVQVQMMALKFDKGYIMNYLTKPDVWGEDDWEEYPIPLEDRYYFHKIIPDLELQDRILTETEKYFPYIKTCSEMLSSAILLEDDEFFYRQFTSRERFLKLKDLNWVENIRQIFNHKNDFYVIK